MSSRQSSIEEKFSQSQDALVLQQSDLSLRSISDMVESRAIDVSPKYQRRERWNKKKESDLIESFILNIPVPPIYLAEDAYGTYSVIDGKQRITAIHRFLGGDLVLEDLDKFDDLNGYRFEDLPAPIRNALTIRPYLRVVTLLRQSDSDLKHEVFLRLNKAGVALNSQEIRNVAFRGPFNDLLFELSENDYFRRVLRATPSSRTYREMIDVQYVLRFFTVASSWDSFSGKMDSEMDKFMQKNYRKEGSELEQYRHDFLRALSACEAVWGDQIFTKPGGSKKVLQGMYDIQMVGMHLLHDSNLSRAKRHPEAVWQALESAIDSNQEFANSISQFTSNPARMKYRIGTAWDLYKSI